MARVIENHVNFEMPQIDKNVDVYNNNNNYFEVNELPFFTIIIICINMVSL